MNCKYLHFQLVLLGKTFNIPTFLTLLVFDRCGLVKFSTKWTDDGVRKKPKQYHRFVLMNHHVRPSYAQQKEIYIAVIHWNWSVTRELNTNGIKEPWNTMLSKEKYLKVLNYLRDEERFDEKSIYFAPNMSIRNMQEELQVLRVHKASMSLNIQERTALSRRDSIVVDQLVESALKEQKKEKHSRFTAMASQPKSKQKLIDELQLQLYALQNSIDSLQAQLNASSTQPMTPAYFGLSRYSMTSSKWHLDNPKSAMEDLGFRSYEEYKLYCKTFWPDMDVHEEPRFGAVMTNFEKITLVKFIFTSDITLSRAGRIYGISHPQVSKIMKQFAPEWGKIGTYLSMLTVTPEYIKCAQTQHFIDAGHKECSFGCDGKDFMCEDVVSNSALLRCLWSDKVSHSALRCLVWNLQTGLTVEHTPLVGARSTENDILHWWGQHPGYIKVNKLNPKLSNLLQNKRKVDFSESTQRHLLQVPKRVRSTPNNTSGRNKGLKLSPDNVANSHEENGTSDYWRKVVLKYTTKTDAKISIDGTKFNDKLALWKMKNEFLMYYGPDGTEGSKIEQLKILLQLNSLYESEQLSYCALSHYCYFMQEYLLQLLHILEGKSPTRFFEYATRLGKFPGSTYGLCDRGFRRTSCFYPNLNAILYPSFISEADGNKQFSKSQLHKDKPLKSVRWKEEAVYSRCTDERYISGTVTYTKLRYMQHCFDWSLARNNLRAEFVAPVKQVPYKKLNSESSESDTTSNYSDIEDMDEE